VAELVLDRPQVGSGGQGQCGGAVPQVVQADWWQPGSDGEFPEVLCQPVRGDWFAVAVVNA
jgi:hypothetical protein